ncbi:hypothetical protein DMH03_32500 [Amycolatopsis sp. WAC 01376]|uniref:class I adenylate-forming enzyme family protein n=1 Tax=Amycolatopsis sp. WAC 01376 TaxID=2203195 RepID=UPI000F76BBAC|nr:class I adenylate-forming enzyme family protein [Amycolatopsis sp. WAC 01376]RSM56216.1 hypothetical protein DMH03_32500 [Amycolatopsis sp. WAC 01376]
MWTERAATPVRAVLRARLKWNRERVPDRTALRVATATGWDHTTWAELDHAVAQVERRATGLPGGPVVVVANGDADSVATLFGLMTSGVDVVVLESQSSTVDDPRSVVHRIGASTVVGVPERPHRAWRAEAAPPGTAGFGAPDGEVLQLTSGSTGEPKLARQPLRNVLSGALTYRRTFELTADDSVVVAVPVAHSFGLIGGLLASLVSGADVWTLPRFTVRRVVEALDGGATALLATPLAYRLLIPALPAAERALRVALSSGAPLTDELANGARRRLGCPVRQVYGSTETGLITCHPASATVWPAGSVGTAPPGTELLVDDAGRVLVRTPTLYEGYAGTTGPVRLEDGFYDTGDTGRIEDGHLFLTGRKTTFVNVGGRKVNPRRIERFLGGTPGVRDVAVYGDTDDRTGEQRLHAAVVLAPGTTKGDVLASCRELGLLPYETPHRLVVLERVPRTAMGKVDARRLREALGAVRDDESEGVT